MKHLVAHYDIAKLLKDLGFDKPCFGNHIDANTYFQWDVTYNKDTKAVKAPTYDQIIDWFESKYNLYLVQYLDDKLKWKWLINQLLNNL